MKTLARQDVYPRTLYGQARTLLLAAALLFAIAATGLAQAPGGFTNHNYFGDTLMTWSFSDTNSWTSDLGCAPISLANVTVSPVGDGTAVEVDSPDSAWLQYNVTESSGTNNLTVDRGSVMFWFAPHWTGTNEGGTGPGTWGRLLEVGSVNSNGWWSLYLDPAGANLYFSVQTNGGTPVTYLTAPIDWAVTNRWHQIVLNYSATNTALYVDDIIAANGSGLANFPGADVLAHGFLLGSDHAGNHQARGLFDDVYTYNHPMRYGSISAAYMTGMLYFLLNPLNQANYASAPYTPADSPTVNVISGTGVLQSLGVENGCTTGTNVWIKNMNAAPAGNGTMHLTFTITGGAAGGWYDLFGTAALASPISDGPWAWLGQGTNCGSYGLNLANAEAFLMLGTALDSDEDGLTDAYERLVSHTDPYNPDSDGDGWTDGEEILNGTDPKAVDQPFKIRITRPQSGNTLQ